MKKKPPAQHLQTVLFVNNTKRVLAGLQSLGGKRSNEKKREASDRAYKKFGAIWDKESPGKDRAGKLKLRRAIAKKMAKEHFVDPQSGEFPSERTLRKRYPAK